ncbi:MAG: hypothetical protein AAGJ18_18080, partial [Bacteroidota bacterium]
KINTLLAFGSLVLLVLFSACTQDLCDRSTTFVRFDPVYLQVDEIRKDIQIQSARSLNQPGKLYYYNDYIIINERREGLHIIDNRNSDNPQNIAFIKIPGNIDMAVKNNVLYADNYIDLLAIDISNPAQPTLISRTENVFESLGLNEDLGHLVYYEETTVTEEINCTDNRWGNPWFFEGDVLFANQVDVALEAAPTNNSGLPASTGIGGSLAQFTITQNHLYVVDEWNLKVFDLIDCENPDFINTVNVGWGIETIYPYLDNLFIGAADGMYIFDNTNPTAPRFLSKFEHARACDPVVVDGDIAYVTLRDGTTCEGFNNQLDVVDVSTLTRPRLLKTYPMDNPRGLAIKDKKLYICDGDSGLKSYDATNWETIDENQLAHIRGFSTYDVIALPNDLLLVIGDDGFYQFSIENAKDLREVSVIPVSRS